MRFNLQQEKTVITIGSLIVILISLALTFALTTLNPTPPVTTSTESQKQDRPDQKQQNSIEPINHPASFTTILENYHMKDHNLQPFQKEIKQLIQTQYQGNLFNAKDDILQALKKYNLNIEQMGPLFLPDHPSFATKKSYSQLDVPLILQKSPIYNNIKYGPNIDDTLGENGCAIVSLAMVHSYLSNRLVDPKEVLSWSHDDYFIDNQGTSWTIFADYALAKGFNFYNHGDNFDSAMEAVQNGEVVIASVTPGFFTDVGHIIVIRGYEPGYVYVNDPNDNPEKMYSVQPIAESVLIDEGVNYWSFYN